MITPLSHLCFETYFCARSHQLWSSTLQLLCYLPVGHTHMPPYLYSIRCFHSYAAPHKTNGIIYTQPNNWGHYLWRQGKRHKWNLRLNTQGQVHMYYSVPKHKLSKCWRDVKWVQLCRLLTAAVWCQITFYDVKGSRLCERFITVIFITMAGCIWGLTFVFDSWVSDSCDRFLS